MTQDDQPLLQVVLQVNQPLLIQVAPLMEAFRTPDRLPGQAMLCKSVHLHIIVRPTQNQLLTMTTQIQIRTTMETQLCRCALQCSKEVSTEYYYLSFYSVHRHRLHFLLYYICTVNVLSPFCVIRRHRFHFLLCNTPSPCSIPSGFSLVQDANAMSLSANFSSL